MNEVNHHILLTRERLARRAGIGVLTVLGALAIVGPSGVMAWADNLALLDQRRAEIAQLKASRDELRNRVALLDPNHADPDLVGELLRSKLNVAHPDDVVIVLNH
jgi:cell division protein FtsB